MSDIIVKILILLTVMVHNCFQNDLHSGYFPTLGGWRILIRGDPRVSFIVSCFRGEKARSFSILICQNLCGSFKRYFYGRRVSFGEMDLK